MSTMALTFGVDLVFDDRVKLSSVSSHSVYNDMRAATALWLENEIKNGRAVLKQSNAFRHFFNAARFAMPKMPLAIPKMPRNLGELSQAGKAARQKFRDVRTAFDDARKYQKQFTNTPVARVTPSGDVIRAEDYYQAASKLKSYNPEGFRVLQNKVKPLRTTDASKFEEALRARGQSQVRVPDSLLNQYPQYRPTANYPAGARSALVRAAGQQARATPTATPSAIQPNSNPLGLNTAEQQRLQSAQARLQRLHARLQRNVRGRATGAQPSATGAQPRATGAQPRATGQQLQATPTGAQPRATGQQLQATPTGAQSRATGTNTQQVVQGNTTTTTRVVPNQQTMPGAPAQSVAPDAYNLPFAAQTPLAREHHQLLRLEIANAERNLLARGNLSEPEIAYALRQFRDELVGQYAAGPSTFGILGGGARGLFGSQYFVNPFRFIREGGATNALRRRVNQRLQAPTAANPIQHVSPQQAARVANQQTSPGNGQFTAQGVLDYMKENPLLGAAGMASAAYLGGQIFGGGGGNSAPITVTTT